MRCPQMFSNSRTKPSGNHALVMGPLSIRWHGVPRATPWQGVCQGGRGGWKRPFDFPIPQHYLVALFFLLCCRCCQALLRILFSPSAIFLGVVSPGPDHAGGFLWRWDLASPTTFSPCGFKHPSPDALCVFRRQPEGLSEATPSLRRLLGKARKNNGPPPPAPRPKPDSTPTDRSRRFAFCPLW
jgi:hypothetical protein